ncbi:MAG: DUF4492 domain-containing protein [uncultured Sulfurovum sp.]|uniref:DUF4492 domain-containing protein n=1 Tax=uncultured Sulfurovum sp. TaxID=269237 RepID=A0A6S6RW62_9BACT|nr:MAG: DUF4492 domain-containing protein [uncultured Sulfurovum sp.]
MNIVINVFSVLKKVFYFYVEGFKNMKLGKTLWGIIGIKFLLFFILMKIFFFPNFLKENFSNDTQRANHILEKLTKENK